MHSDKYEDSAPVPQPTQVRWLIFVLIGAVSWLLYLHRYSWGVIKPAFRMEHPQLTDTELGWLDSAFLATYAFGQPPSGLIGDLFGSRAVLVLIILLWSLTVAALGWINGFWPLFGMRCAFGLGQAGAYPLIGKITGSWYPSTVRTSVQGVVTSLGRVGGACAPLLVATLLMGELGLSWRIALVAIALPGALLAAVFWLVFRNNPVEHPWTNFAEQKVIAVGTSPGGSGKRASLRLTRSTCASMIMLLNYAFISTFADMLYVFWIPLFLVEGKGLNEIEMGLFAPLPLLGGAVGGMIGGLLNDLFLRNGWSPRWTRSGIALTGKGLAAVLIVSSLPLADGRLVMVLLLACKFFADWSLPTQWGTITDMAGKGAGTVFGVVNSVGALGGFAAGPVMGYLKQHYGWEGLFLGVGAAYLISALTWLFIDCTRRLVVSA